MAKYFYAKSNSTPVLAYDEEHPLKNQETLANEMLKILQSYSDNGWMWHDNNPAQNAKENARDYIFDTFEYIRVYASTAIANHRAELPSGLPVPLASNIPVPGFVFGMQLENALSAMQWAIGMQHLIYYLWETEEDPVLLKEKLLQAFLAHPLHDISIDLKEDSGSELHVYPSFHSIDT